MIKRINPNLIIRQAIDLFNAGGVENIKIRALAKRCCCTTMPLYSHFGSINNLRSATLNQVFEDLKIYLSTEDNSDLKQTIQHILEYFPGFVFEIERNTDTFDRLSQTIKIFFPARQLHEIKITILLRVMTDRIKKVFHCNDDVIDNLIRRTI